MKYCFVRPSGEVVRSAEFDVVPVPNPIKGVWLIDTAPAYDSKTQILTRDAVQSVSAPSITYTVSYRPLVEIKEYKKDLIDQEYYAAVSADVSYMGHPFQADEASQALLTATLVTLNGAGGVPPDFGWWDTNNVKVLMNLAQINGLAQTIFAQGMVAFATKRARKDLVDVATKVEDVLAI